MTVLPGLVGISLARNPDGAVAEIAEKVRERFERFGAKGRHGVGSPSTLHEEEAEQTQNGQYPTLVPELVGAGGRATAQEIRALDHELGLPSGRCDADSGDS
jgi:hypothetical protein